MFVDSHAHITGKDMIHDLPLLLDQAKKAHVDKVVVICSDSFSLREGLKAANTFPAIALASAVHPHDAPSDGATAFHQEVVAAAKKGELKAIGETGLDYFYGKAHAEKQKSFLFRSIELAHEVDLPLVFHCRDAFADLFALCAELKRPALVHCFTGTLEEAREAVARGWYISFSGIITFKNSATLREVVAAVPMERMLIETDAPFLAPQSKRGQRNSPANVVEVAEQVAQIKQLPIKEVAHITTQNACHFFSLTR